MSKPQPVVLRYGDGPSQIVELTRPDGPARGVVVVIHGGFWRARYDLDLGRPLAADLAARGWVAANVEYRRVGEGPGGGGGHPQTLDDVAAAIDLLATLDPPLTLSTVVTLGHSAGGHLATWAASRGRYPRWAGGVAVTAVVSQAGVVDLGAAHAEHLGDGAVEAFLGHAPVVDDPGDAAADPLRQVPLEAPVWCVHGTEDEVVPPSQSRTYVEAATRAGARATLVEVPGDHRVVIEVGSSAWRGTLGVLDGLG